MLGEIEDTSQFSYEICYIASSRQIKTRPAYEGRLKYKALVKNFLPVHGNCSKDKQHSITEKIHSFLNNRMLKIY